MHFQEQLIQLFKLLHVFQIRYRFLIQFEVKLFTHEKQSLDL